jgi:hypothetical protein
VVISVSFAPWFAEIIVNTVIVLNADVSLSEENLAVVQQGQSDPHGPELAPVDTSVLGHKVIIDKVNRPPRQNKTS